MSRIFKSFLLILVLLASCATPPNPHVQNDQDKKNLSHYACEKSFSPNDSSNLQTLANKADSCEKEGKKEKALEFLYKVVSNAPDNRETWHHIARIEMDLGHYKKAIAASLKCRSLSLEIRKNALEYLKKEGFTNETLPLLSTKDIPSYQSNVTKAGEQLSLMLSIDRTGKVLYAECIAGESVLCSRDVDFFKDISFLPAWDFMNDQPIPMEISITVRYSPNEKTAIFVSSLTDEDHYYLNKDEFNSINIEGIPKNILGKMDRAYIDHYIREKIEEVKDCYLKELPQKENLAGKVVVHFIIGKTGTVTIATLNRSTMNDESTENCIVDVIRKIVFPKPKDDGIVIVNYPFIFKHTD